jgi:hypothetical protein
MKFGRLINGEVHTENVDTILMTEQELYDAQQIPGPGAWEIHRDGRVIHVLVTPTPDSPAATHDPVEAR